MKKFFTFAAAVLASMSLLAAEPALETMNWGADDFATVIANHDGVTLSTHATGWSGNFSGETTRYIALGGGTDLSAASPTPYFAVSATSIIDSIEVYWAPNGGDASNIAWAAWTDDTNLLNQDVDFLGQTAEFTGAKSTEGATWQMIDLSNNEVKAIMLGRQIKKAKLDGAEQSNIGKNKTINIIGIRVWLNNAVPSADPVSQVTIAGPEACYVGQKVTYAAEFDVRPNAIKWFVNGEEQENSRASFEFTPAAAGNYSISCSAKNDYNADFVVSNVIALVVSERPVLEQVSISETTYWSWENASDLDEIKFTAETSPAKNERCLLANVEGMNNNDSFNSQALLFEGEYAKRVQSNMPLCQGQLLQFNTTVPGYVTVEYSNTGNRSAAEGETEGQEALRRFVTINGNVVGTGSMVSNTLSYVLDVPVEAGDVAISGCMPYSENPTAPQYLRFYKVVFSILPLATSVDNTNAEVKAVKVVRNGQLFIEKNGVVYNAQGAVVK